MALTNGKCSFCGNVIQVPDDVESFDCPSCGMQIPTSTAIADTTSNATTVAESANAEQAPIEPPLINGWRTNVGLVAAGAIVGMMIYGGLLAAANNVTDWNTAFTITLISMTFILSCLCYALSVYPTFFKPEPLLTSNAAVSFLNGLMGGVIFGCLWCHNMTRKSIGVSHFAYSSLIVIVVAAMVVTMLS